jgi:hypothetical protein
MTVGVQVSIWADGVVEIRSEKLAECQQRIFELSQMMTLWQSTFLTFIFGGV